MTYSEAIGYLKTLKNRIPVRFFTNDGAKRYDEFCEKSISALEKQKPIKPIRKERSGMGYEYEDYYCACGKFIGYEPQINSTIEDGKIPFKYCPDCGQKLDWR